jgi:hypothetical protein
MWSTTLCRISYICSIANLMLIQSSHNFLTKDSFCSPQVSFYNHVSPLLSSWSVNTVCFVTARAIDLKLCTYIPLGHMTYQTKFQSDLILGLATRGPKLKTQKVLRLLIKWLDHPLIFIRGISSKDTWHNTRVFDLTYFWRSQRSNFI